MTYEKQFFEEGQVLTAEALNRMDDEIGMVHNYKVVDLAIFMGQSNMAGRGVASQAPTVPEGHGYEFRAMTDPTRLYPVTEPFGRNENNPSSGVNESIKTGSMVSAFVNAYYAQAKVPLVCIACSQGNTSIDFWLPGTKPFADAMDRHARAKQWLTDNGYTVRHDFAVWCQGEADAGTYQTYNTRMKQLIAGMKQNGIEKCFISRVGHVTTSDNYRGIIDVQTELCKTYEDAVMVSCMAAGFKYNGMMKDVVHYTQPAYNLLGTECGRNTAIYLKTGIEPSMLDHDSNMLYLPYGDIQSKSIIDENLNVNSTNAVQNKIVASTITELLARIDSLTDEVYILKAGGEANIKNVTLSLTNTMATSNARRAIVGQPYQNTLTPINGATQITEVSVIMGGEDVTAEVYADGVINISSVTGDLEISALSENVLLYLDFTSSSIDSLIAANIIEADIVDTTIETIQDENGLCLNGAHPNGFNLPAAISVPEKWTLTFEVKYGDTMSSYGLLGSNTSKSPSLAPCVLSNGSTVQVRFNKDDTGRIDSSASYLLYDNEWHTYIVECPGNYKINTYRDGVLVDSNLAYTQGSTTGYGSWTRVLGVDKTYSDSSSSFKTDGDYYIKRIKLTGNI
jgi:hypothetical protein